MVYKTQGTCSREIHFDVENNKLKNVSFVGGCNGNLKGIGLLVEGMDIDEVIKRVEGVSCNGRPTSCPDQLARALKQYTIYLIAFIHRNIKRLYVNNETGF